MTFSSRNVGAARFGIAIIILLLYGAALFVAIYTPVPPENREIFAGLVGGLNLALGGVISHYLTGPARRGVNGA